MRSRLRRSSKCSRRSRSQRRCDAVPLPMGGAINDTIRLTAVIDPATSPAGCRRQPSASDLRRGGTWRLRVARRTPARMSLRASSTRRGRPPAASASRRVLQGGKARSRRRVPSVRSLRCVRARRSRAWARARSDRGGKRSAIGLICAPARRAPCWSALARARARSRCFRRRRVSRPPPGRRPDAARRSSRARGGLDDAVPALRALRGLVAGALGRAPPIPRRLACGAACPAAMGASVGTFPRGRRGVCTGSDRLETSGVTSSL